MTTSNTTDTQTAAPDFEFFQGKLTESRTLPQITVRRGGLIVLTRAAVDMLGEGTTHVQLAYNGKSGAVGVRASAQDAPGCYRLRTQGKSPAKIVAGKRFFGHHGLAVDKARTFAAEEFGNGIVGFRLPTEEPKEQPEPAGAEATKPTARRKAKAA